MWFLCRAALSYLILNHLLKHSATGLIKAIVIELFKNFTFIQDRPQRDTFMDHLQGANDQRFVQKESIEKFKGDSKYKREKMLVNLDK